MSLKKVAIGLFFLFCICFILLQGNPFMLKVPVLSEKNKYEKIGESFFKKEVFEEDVKTTPLLFIGDIMLGRYVEVLKNKEGLNPFGNTVNILRSHVTMANLEGPIPNIHKPSVINSFSFSFASSTPKLLRDNGITAVSLSNNHLRDQGLSGYENTKKVLDNEGIGNFGGYSSKDLGYFETKLGTTTVIIFGVNMISIMLDEKITHDFVLFLRQKFPEAYLISFVHWGNEYDSLQNETQRKTARMLIDDGVSLVIGSHPHVVQGVEVYKGVPIFYSLGNFIFDQYFLEETQEGIMVSVDKKEETLSFSIFPVVSKRSKTMIADEKTAKKIRERIIKSSSLELQDDLRKGSFSLPRL